MTDTASKLKILIYGSRVLRRKSEPISVIDGRIVALAEAMLQTMHAAHGIGLAAQQIGETVRMCVIDLPAEYDIDERTGLRLNPHVSMPLVLVNPQILSRSGSAVAVEGCLSFPQLSFPVRRAFETVVAFQTLDGTRRELLFRGMLARVAQHELDHLDGVLFIDRISALRRVALLPELKKIERLSKTSMKVKNKDQR